MSDVEVILDDETLIKYLILYRADINWAKQIEKLRNKYPNNNSSYIEKRVAATILMPALDRSLQKRDFPPESLLFGCSKFDTFDETDWIGHLKKVIIQDRETLALRTQALDLGVISPIEYNPRARQALHWLMDEVHKSETTADSDKLVIKGKMENLVYIYGGAVICNVFEKPEYSKWIKNLMNWRTSYFFERLIHNVYTAEQILKIKCNDVEQIKRTDPELVKSWC